HHFHNPRNQFGAAFVAETFLRQMQQDEVPLPIGETWTGGPQTFPLRKLGLGFPVLINDTNVDWDYELAVDAGEEPASKDDGKEDKGDGKAAEKKKPARDNNRGAGMFGMNANQPAGETITAPKYDFVIQFCWQVPTPDTMVELAHLYPGDVPEPPADEGKAEAAPPERAKGAELDEAAPADEADDDAAGPSPQPARPNQPDNSADSAAAEPAGPESGNPGDKE
ncbi:MAG: hypothetical protein ACREJM_00690, partial [Candidatus Saccharimonadales bacterium]